MFKNLLSFRTVFDYFKNGWLSLKDQNLTGNWITNDGRIPKPGTIPWANGYPFRQDCTEIYDKPLLINGNGANVKTLRCDFSRRGICEKLACV